MKSLKVVSLSPSLTEIVTVLKAAEALVGVTDICEVQEKKLPRLGSPKSIHVSRIEALSPEWILGDTQDNRPDQIQMLQKKWKVKLFDVKSPESVCDVVAELGRLFQRREEAKRLNEGVRKEISTSEVLWRGRERKRTVFLLWDHPYLTANFDTYPSRLMEASGGINVFHQEPLREFPVEVEDMIERNPEVLLLAGEPAPFRPKHIAEFRRYRIFSQIPIHLIEGRLLNRYGPQTLEALKCLRKLYQELS